MESRQVGRVTGRTPRLVDATGMLCSMPRLNPYAADGAEALLGGEAKRDKGQAVERIVRVGTNECLGGG
jgi:hypothetical protein